MVVQMGPAGVGYHPTPAWLMKHRRGVIVDVSNESWVVRLDQGLISRLAEKELWEQERAAMGLLCCVVVVCLGAL